MFENEFLCFFSIRLSIRHQSSSPCPLPAFKTLEGPRKHAMPILFRHPQTRSNFFFVLKNKNNLVRMTCYMDKSDHMVSHIAFWLVCGSFFFFLTFLGGCDFVFCLFAHTTAVCFLARTVLLQQRVYVSMMSHERTLFSLYLFWCVSLATTRKEMTYLLPAGAPR